MTEGRRTKRTLRVLCAEDDPSIREIMKMVLEKDGHQVELVGDVPRALQRIDGGAAHFDVVITDHEMPTGTGLEVVARLRKIGFAGRIVVHCSELKAVHAAAYRALAVEHFLVKPASLDKILAAVSR